MFGITPERLAFTALAYPILLFSLCFHEWSHAMSAKFFGDRTAELQGRLTMNPIVHIDPIGTVIFPLIVMLTGFPYVFGWAKPVPVDPVRMRKMKDIVWVSLAGPGSNLLLVLAAVLGFKIYLLAGAPGDASFVQRLASIFIILNLVLMWFNLIPLTPLDGSRVVLAHVRPTPFWAAYEQYGFLILILLFATGGLGLVFGPFLSASEFVINTFLHL
jgi:Zn-dependent protease